MNNPQSTLLQQPIADILARWPQTSHLFIEYKLDCVGCTMSGFETLEEGLRAYNLDPEPFLQSLVKIIQQQSNPENDTQRTSPGQSLSPDHGE